MIKESVRRKDFYVLFVMTAVITILMGSVNLYNDSHIVRYLKEICLLWIWISSLVMAARQIPVERETRTIFPLLAKPIRRSEVLAGKFLGCWLAMAITLAAFYAFFGLVAMSKEHEWPLANYFQAIWLHWVMLGIVISMSLLGSLIFSAVSANATICLVTVIFILLVGGTWTRWLCKWTSLFAPRWRRSFLSFRTWNFSTCATWSFTIGRR